MKNMFNKKMMLNFDKKLMKNIIQKPEKIAWNRLGKQKGISMFGDKDKDKLMNIFDCDPLDKKKQTTYHKTLNLLRGKGFKEDIDTVKIEGPQTRDIQSGQYVVRPNQPVTDIEALKVGYDKIKSGASAVASGASTVASGIKEGASSVWQATGLPQKLVEREEQTDW